jgi:heme/copper-type cytochrome/quinol oxidase subunit 2
MFEKTLYHNPVTTFQMGFQDPASPVAEGISAFHNDLRVLIRFILRFVVFVIHYCITTFSKDAPATLTYSGDKNAYMANVLQNKTSTIDSKWGKTQYRRTHGTILEILWTTIPALILVQIAIPSFSLLYSVDEIIEPLFNFKVVGHQ